MTEDFIAEAESLADHDAVAEAEEILAEHQARLAEAQAVATDADAAVLLARSATEALVDRVVAGDAVTRSDVAAAHDHVRHAEAFAAFSAVVARRLEAPVASAREALADTRALAWQAVLDLAIDRRIAVGVRADRARLLGHWGTNTPPDEARAREAAAGAALEALRPEFDQANALLTYAIANGARSGERATGARPQWPTSEIFERRYWGRALTVEELNRVFA